MYIFHNSFSSPSIHCMYYTNHFREFAGNSNQKKSKFNHLRIEFAPYLTRIW